MKPSTNFKHLAAFLRKKKVILSCALLSCVMGMPAYADLLQDIKDRGYVRVATEARFTPFEFIEDGKVVGYDFDLLAKVLEALPGIELRISDLPWQGVLPALTQGKVDFVVAAASPLESRRKFFDFTIPIADASLAFVVRADEQNIKQSADVVGKIVGSQSGASQIFDTEAYDKELIKEHGKGMAQIKGYVSFDEAYADLLNRRVDAVSQSLPNLLFVQKQHPDKYKVITPPFGQQAYFNWVVRNDDASKSLLEFLDGELKKFNHDGTMNQLQEKWFGYAMNVPDYIPRYQ
ncbi:transporter substrate-binding domain-containing protein [Castellaniella sp.]|uniref:transporter substrate-binding domain-containing protein n=1 Tax=Castellaniella sp. TaxID=1955812 RepID=UPI00355CE42B